MSHPVICHEFYAIRGSHHLDAFSPIFLFCLHTFVYMQSILNKGCCCVLVFGQSNANITVP